MCVGVLDLAGIVDRREGKEGGCLCLCGGVQSPRSDSTPTRRRHADRVVIWSGRTDKHGKDPVRLYNVHGVRAVSFSLWALKGVGVGEGAGIHLCLCGI